MESKMMMEEKQMYKRIGTTRSKPSNLMVKKVSTIAHGSYNSSAMMANQGASCFLGAPNDSMVHNNPFSSSGKEVMKNMKMQYGNKKGKQVFYATMNKKGMKHKWEK